VHEYFTVNGQKMSKTLGNVIDPITLIQQYGAEPLRYYFLAKFTPFNDGDFSEEEFKKTYNADLANGLGNLMARIAKLASLSPTPFTLHPLSFTDPALQSVRDHLDAFEFNEALSVIWAWISDIDKIINEDKPWTLQGDDLHQKLETYINKYILKIASALQPFLPEISKKINDQFTGPTIKTGSPLFPRIL
jgi:methionyl-tRNA synthetase